MANLLANDIGLNYKGLLNLDTTINTGLDGTLRVVTDGEGDSSPLYLSTTAIGLGTTSIWDNTNGRLGIGTTSPSYKLHVGNGSGGGNGTAATFTYIENGQLFVSNVKASTPLNQFTFDSLGSKYGHFYSSGAATSNIALGGSSGINTLPASATMYWDIDNNYVGIGTTSPSNQLSTYANVVAGSSSPTGVAIENASSTGYVNLSFKNNAGTAQFFYSGNARGSTLNNLFSFYNPSTAGYAFDQKVSIGTSVIATGGMLEVTAASSTVGLYVKGAASTDIARFYDSSSALVSYVDSAGSVWTNLCRVSLTNQHDIRGVGNSMVLRANGTDFLANNALYSEFKTDGGTNANFSWSVGKGSAAVASALLEVVSTTRGFLPPRMTTAQKSAIASPAAGLMVYDTDLAKLCVYTTAWETITSL